MMTPPATNAPELGFSLFEVLIAVALLAMIAALCLPVVSNAARVEAGIAAETDRWSRQQAVETVFRDLLLRAQAAPRGVDALSFTGDGSRLSFLTRPDGQGDLVLARIQLSRDALLVSLEPVTHPADLLEPVRIEADLSAGRLLYFGAETPGAAPVWRERWDAALPPRLVVLDMTRDDGQVRRIEAHVGGGAPVDCRFDSGLGICLGDEA
ncbi:type II secretion system protein J [Maricaulis sp.]|uniref:PulJ/GspJ family protein n=1 Tax=Maricaulis sp. TaxID=1486257 RepID=UPI0025C51926|nr:prepilin-type N-terminal cleavage/methylation domain-containing protein [Maricaulis sp.]